MWAKYGSQSSDFSVGILFVTFCLAQAARVIGCPGVCINIKNGYGRPGPLCYQRLPQSRYYHVLWIKVLLASNSGCFRLNKWFRLVQALQRSRTLGALKTKQKSEYKISWTLQYKILYSKLKVLSYSSLTWQPTWMVKFHQKWAHSFDIF